MMSSRVERRSTIGVVVASLVTFGCQSAPSKHSTWLDGRPAPPIEALEVTRGESYSLSEHSGTVKLVSFGKTACGEACPMPPAKLHAVLDQLGPRAEAVEVLYVSTDPQRDTPRILRDFLEGFDSRIEGLHVDGAALAQLIEAYDVRQTDAGAPSAMLLIDAAGRLRIRFSSQAEAEEVARVVAKLVDAENRPSS